MYCSTSNHGDSDAYYSSIKTKGDYLFKKSEFEGALTAYDEVSDKYRCN